MDVKIKPTLNYVLVQAEAKDDKTPGGLYIPESAKSNKKSNVGEVLAVGPGKYENGALIKVGVEPGDSVLFSKYSGVDLEIGEGLIIMPENEIIAILK